MPCIMTESDKHMYRMLKSGAQAFSAQTISAHAASGPAFCAAAMPPKPNTYPARNGQRAPGVAGSPSGPQTKALHREWRNSGQRHNNTIQLQWLNVENGNNETTAFGQVALLSFPRFLDGQRLLPNTSSGQGRMGFLMYGCTAFGRYDKHHESKNIEIL